MRRPNPLICPKCGASVIPKKKCKNCHRLRMAEWRKNNPGLQKCLRAKFYAKNKDRLNDERKALYRSSAEYREKRKHRDKAYTQKGRRKELYVVNREKELLRNKNYRDKNKEQIKAYALKYNEENREFVLSIGEKYRSKNRHTINAKRRMYGKKQVDSMDPKYIKQIISQALKVPIRDIPNSLVELKQNALGLKRQIKKLKK